MSAFGPGEVVEHLEGVVPPYAGICATSLLKTRDRKIRHRVGRGIRRRDIHSDFLHIGRWISRELRRVVIPVKASAHFIDDGGRDDIIMGHYQAEIDFRLRESPQ